MENSVYNFYRNILRDKCVKNKEKWEKLELLNRETNIKSSLENKSKYFISYSAGKEPYSENMGKNYLDED